MAWLYRTSQGCLIAALWLVTAARREAKYRVVIQAILFVSLAVVTASVERGSQTGVGDLSSVLLLAPLVLPTVMIHEISHGWVALRLGDPTAKDKGRLSLNPLRHMSFKWTVLFPITTYYLFKVALVMPKPVPVNARNFENPRKGIMWVGLAGPAVNISMMLFFALLLGSGIIPGGETGDFVRQLLAVLIVVNMVLAMFNLIPIPPLDGSRLLIGLLPEREAAFLIRTQILGLLLIFAAVIGAAMSIGLADVLLPPVKFIWRILGLDVNELRRMLAE